MNRLLKTVLAAGLLASGLAVAQVPSLINYQGRLTDANGAAVTGSKTFAISIYDDATAGNLLYTEDIGSVTLDANGVYSFQFGAAGTNYSLVTETLATTDGTATTYQKALSKSNIVAGTTSVTDGTYSWTETAGNPGSTSTATATAMFGFVVSATVTSGGSAYADAPAVTITGSGTGATATATVSNGAVTDITITNAGSGYTTGATITIAPPPSPFRVTYSAGSITATYATAPAAGTAISATYRYGASGITGALASSSQPWMAVSVNGTVQGTRQRVLAVPFAINAARASVAISLERSIKTCQLVVLSPTSPSTTVNSSTNTQMTTRRNLPATVSPNNIGNGTADSFYQIFDSYLSIIHSLSSNVTISSNVSQYYPPAATIELVAYNKTGQRIVVSSQTRNASGMISLVGPFVLDCAQNQYFIECAITTGGDSNNRTNNTTTLSPIEMKYE